MKTGDLDLVAWTEVGFGQAQSRSVNLLKLRVHSFVVALPFPVCGAPLGLGQLVDIGCDTVVFPGADKMLGEIALRKVPVIPQLAERIHSAGVGHVRSWVDGEIRMSQLVGPLVVGVRHVQGRRSV